MSKRLKMTSQRELVLEYVKHNHAHPTAYEIYTNLKERLPRISKKTVYNNLKTLSEAGLIREICTRDVKRYEPVMKPHHHLICRVCDGVFDIQEEKLTKLANTFAETLKDFEVSSTATHFYGVCNDCKSREII